MNSPSVPPSHTHTITHTLSIQGMDCADCALTLEKGLATLPGVRLAQVNFAAATLTVEGEASLDSIQGRVQQLGYAVAGGAESAAESEPAPASVRSERGGVLALGQYLLSTPATRQAIFAFTLIVIAALLELWAGPAWMGHAAFGLHLVVVALAGPPIMRRGLRALRLARKVTIDLLMSIATLGALLIGESGEAATVIVLFAIGEALEGFTAECARASLRALLSLRPERVTVLRPCLDCIEHRERDGYNGGACPWCGVHEASLPVEQAMVGETALIRPGERIPVDGIVLRGASMVNQAPVTGESIPVGKDPGDVVYAGSVNGEVALEVRITQAAQDSTISKIVRLVEQAQAQRAPVERFVDRFAAWYTPSVVIAAFLLAILPPLLFGAPFFDTPDSHGWLYRSLALLIVACPCSLVISTPVTMVSALTGLARRGVLVKGGRFLDALARVQIFAFDKTGTLTEGRPAVRQVYSLGCIPGTDRCPACDDMLALAAAVERRSAHPLAQVVVAEAEARQLAHVYAAAEDVESLAGKGVRGQLNGCDVWVGSHALLHEVNGRCALLHEQIHAAEAAGQTVMVISRCQEVLGFVGVEDVVRPVSRQALAALKKMDPHLRIVMLTGDNLAVARQIASELGTLDDVRAGLLPQDKADAVRRLLAENGPLAMVGDGVNDAPALATASVGIAMGGAGSAQALETADVVLMQDDLARLPVAVQSSRKALRIIQQNIIFSLALKAAFLLLTLPGWATLWMAVFADMGASLLVTFNGMRARR